MIIPANKIDLKGLKKFAARHVNCARVTRVYVKNNDLRFEIEDCRHGNILDSASMNSLLSFLKAQLIVGPDVNTMWVGFYEGKLTLWCAR